MEREKLNSYLGQLIDLKTGILKELVLTKDNEALTMLMELIIKRIKELDAREQFEKDNKPKAVCTKCGNEILADENSLCGNCI